MTSWWGPVDVADGGTTYDDGGQWPVNALVHGVADGLVEVVLVGAGSPPSCEAYANFLREAGEVDAYVARWLDTPADERPSKEDVLIYACQALATAGESAFGDRGAYRAVHLLVDPSGGQPEGDLFRAGAPTLSSTDHVGAEALSPGHYVGRVYERQVHGDGVLPCDRQKTACWEGDVDPIAACPGILSQLILEAESGRDDYPDHAAVGFQAASHRYYHSVRDQDAIDLGTSGSLPLGVTLANATATISAGGSVSATLFSTVTRVEDAFPYRELLLSTGVDLVPLSTCSALDGTEAWVWPELGPPDVGDDDSAR